MTIIKSYTNFVNIPIIKNSIGEIYTDPLWAKDIQLHLNYINCFNLCCPIVNHNETGHLENITHYKINEIIPLRKDNGLISIVKNIIPNFLSVIKACKKSDIVHSSGAGWAFPLSFYILFLRPFIKFQWVIVIESSFWLLGKNDRLSIRKIIVHISHKYLLTLCVKSADARIFTQSFYRTLFLGNDTNNTMINPASWVNQENLQSVENFNLLNKNKGNKTLEFIFPTRLIEDKGVNLLLNAIRLLKNMDVIGNVTIIGDGPLKTQVIDFTRKDYGGIKLIYLEPVDYGTQFFKLLQHYDIVLVPNLKEEQPRIIFDAFSQGVGVIASDTSGIMDIVAPNKNAFIFKAGDADALAAAMAKAIKNPVLVTNLGLAGLSYANGKTHAQMHQDRIDFLQSTLKL